MTLAILLSIDAPYVAVDQVLGGMNIANLLLRFVIFAAIFFLGLRMARGFSADDALRLITGPVGIAVAAAASAGRGGRLPDDGYRRLLGGAGRRVRQG